MAIDRRIEEEYRRAMAGARSQREVADIEDYFHRRYAMYNGYHMPSAFSVTSWANGAFDMGEPSQPLKPLPEEHLVEAVTGFRAWNVPLFVDELRSVAHKTKWKPYERFEANCESAQCSGVSCACGIYAFKKMDSVQSEYKSADRSRRYVWGECWLWGRVLECKDGYRAQFGYPKAFVNNGAIAKRMAEVFGVKLL